MYKAAGPDNYRYGWEPEDEERNPEGKSITWLECEEAAVSLDEVERILAE